MTPADSRTTDEGPVLYHLLLEGILDEDAKGNMPAKPAASKSASGAEQP